MLFSSITFLYWFLPLVVAVYYLVPRPGGSLLWRNLWLFVASIFFYAWGEPLYVLVMLAQSVVGWLSGLLIEHWRGKPLAKLVLWISLIAELSSLLFFKYTDFFISNLNRLFNSELALLALALPLGISFYTFQILSYSIDLYHGKVQVQKNLLVFLTYVTLFAQLVAGPIVRYALVEQQLTSRQHSLQSFADGIRRFSIGLAKKVLIANTLGQLVSLARFNLHEGGEQSLLFALLFLVAFTLQIYYDFSGYSDMAIGLRLLFGFRLPENFDHPLVAKSLTDFWRRWHMTMSFWFRDYVYIPLGGNRVSPARHLLNILLVWMVTGLWHGAGWNFILWGLFMAVVLILEKYLLAKVLERLPVLISHLYLLVVIMLSWVLFESATLGQAQQLLLTLLGMGSGGLAGSSSIYYLLSYLPLMLLAAFGSTTLPVRAVAWLEKRAGLLGLRLRAGLEPAFIALLLVVATAFVVDGSFNPFIYFRF